MKKYKFNSLLKKEDGFSLVEVIAAIVILGIASILALSIFTQMGNTNKRTKENLDTTNIGKQLLYEFELLGNNKMVKLDDINECKSIATISNLVVSTVEGIPDKNNPDLCIYNGIYNYHSGDVYDVDIIIKTKEVERAPSLEEMKIEVKNSNGITSTTVHGYLTVSK